MKKRMYVVPNTEIVELVVENMMQLADTSNHIGGGKTTMPIDPKRRTEVF